MHADELISSLKWNIMKHILAWCVGLICVTSVQAGASLKEARQLWLEGNYAEAREMYEELAKNGKERLAATLGLSQALESQGEYDKALKAVEGLLKEKAKDADLLARQAELLYIRGRWEDAEKAAKAALAANEQQFAAHWVLGRSFIATRAHGWRRPTKSNSSGSFEKRAEQEGIERCDGIVPGWPGRVGAGALSPFDRSISNDRQRLFRRGGQERQDVLAGAALR